MKSYTALTQNMFRHLARGEEVQYHNFQVKSVDDSANVVFVKLLCLTDVRTKKQHAQKKGGEETRHEYWDLWCGLMGHLKANTKLAELF